MDFNKLGEEILKEVGGPKNIASLTHCATRLRFVIKDESEVNINAIKSLSGVLQVVNKGGQFQVVIGPSVIKAYDAIIKKINYPDNISSKEESLKTAKKKNKRTDWFSNALGLISSIFTPILGLLCGAGMIKAVLSVLQVTHLIKNIDGTYMILNALGDSVFYFFPVIIGWSAAKKFKLPQSYGIILGAILIYPTIIAAAGAKNLHTIFTGTIFALRYADKFLGIPIALQNYSSSVIPAIILMWISGYIFRFVKKITPDVIKMVFVPFLTILISGILGLIVIGPVAMILQNMLSEFVFWLVGISKGLTGLFLGGFWSLLVMFGLHWAVIPFFAIDVAKYGYDVINPLIFSGALAVLGSSIGVAIRTNNKNTRSISISAAISSFFGVSEPALYGILVPRKWIMITSFLSAGIGGAIAGFGGAKLYSFGANGILGLPCFINPKGIDSGFIFLCISGIAAFFLSLLFALIIGDKNDTFSFTPDQHKKSKNKNITIFSPIKGKAIPLSKVKDEVFSSLTLGNGIAIEPSEGMVYAPMDGIIRVAYSTGHAIGIHSDNGEEILIHIGIDTVNLKGKFFKCYVNQGMRVKRGDLLVKFDLEKIKLAGYDPTVMVIIINSDKIKKVITKNLGLVDNEKNILNIELI